MSEVALGFLLTLATLGKSCFFEIAEIAGCFGCEAKIDDHGGVLPKDL